MFCKNCGNQIVDGENTCKSCGTVINNEGNMKVNQKKMIQKCIKF